ncbi:hypothetical protein Ocepr_0590 [Oceanithermus profundus DSM 14977]|uniref:Protein-glutamine gamma-glutamyltransferase-like C-terminal domain-containing protein n=1 Tax=Oceanithermus profundus (strain DSM 14977 / NBRC 100410 / VKM B-2274 / 506) TaxID=670487 RepID=E4U745_OCEP5|nr:DUF4129 domain-containing protein [Oceanithermus profundus]ADR36048.1 hypothetical protein Ocepr_0590 [Oceanithermus profundus DSM 14977]
MKALLPVAAVFWLVALEPRLWPGALAYLLAWLLLARWQGELVWGAPLFALYLFWGLELSPEAFGDLTLRLQLAGRLTSGLLVWAYAAGLAQRGSRWAVVPLFAWAFLLRPEAGVVGLGLAAWAYWNFWYLRAQYLERGAAFRIAPRALAAAVLAALALAALAGLSGWTPLAAPRAAPPPAPPWAALESPAPEPPPAAPGLAGGAARAPAPAAGAALPGWVDALSRYAAVLAAVASFLLLLVLARIVWILLRPGGRRFGFAPRMLVLAALVLVSLLFWMAWYGFLYGGEGVGAGAFAPRPVPVTAPAVSGGAEPAEPPPAAPRWPGRVLGGALALGTLALAVLIAGLAFVLWRLLRGRASEAADAPAGGAGPRPRTERHAGRVRAAYRTFLLAMRPRLPRQASETPHEYAHRIAVREPALAEAVWGLTRLYEPVRYGGLADEAEAAAAEAWLRRIEAELEKGEET